MQPSWHTPVGPTHHPDVSQDVSDTHRRCLYSAGALVKPRGGGVRSLPGCLAQAGFTAQQVLQPARGWRPGRSASHQLSSQGEAWARWPTAVPSEVCSHQSRAGEGGFCFVFITREGPPGSSGPFSPSPCFPASGHSFKDGLCTFLYKVLNPGSRRIC